MMDQKSELKGGQNLPEVKSLLSEVLTEEQHNEIIKLGYYKCPASTKNHNAFEGGLALHSLNLCKTALQMNEGLNLGISREDIILSTMLHDLCKLSYGYEPNMLKSGKISESKPYTYNAKYDIGHGSGSIYLAQQLGIKLSLPVAQAIMWHMSFDYDKDKLAIDTIKKTPYDMILVWLVQTVDKYSTWVLE